MKFNLVCSNAESKAGYLSDKNHAKIYISAFEDTGTRQDISNAFTAGMPGSTTEVILTGSTGYYYLEPIVRVEKPDRPPVLFSNVTLEAITKIINEYIINDRPVHDLTLGSCGDKKIDGIPDVSRLPLFALQKRLALRNCGLIDPANIDHYILKAKGYSGLDKALKISPVEVISELEKSGLRGKGGAGFHTAEKLRICREAEGEEKYVVCNAADSEPDSLSAGLLLESDPHSVLEGMLTAAYAVGASRCIICVKTGSGKSVTRLEKALEQMKGYSLVGENILDSGFSSVVEMKEVEDLFIAGEETALIRAIEGKQPVPSLRMTYPAVSGINNKPTLVNNLETFGCVSGIFQNGAEWYSGCGTAESKGTKILTLSGSIAQKCIVEVPFGTALNTVVNDIGGGASGDKNIKAVQFGGPLGRYFDADSLGVTIDYESMKQIGTIIGSGVVKIFDDSRCAVEIARDLIDYIQEQSCGKCVFCREGTFQLHEIFRDIAANKGRTEDIDLVNELCEAMKEGCICNFGTNVPNPILSSISLFGSDYESHIANRRCPAA